MALRGLSSPATSRQGNLFGMVGMAIAIRRDARVASAGELLLLALVILGLGIGGGAGAVIARRVPMTSMPELVAAFHSLVGMAAVLVAAAALYAPRAFDIGMPGDIPRASLIEMSLGVAIGAVTFTGSVIAFLKLSARMSGAPILLFNAFMVVMGLGFGLIIRVMSVAAQNAVDFRYLGVVTSSSQFFRQIGGVMGTAIFGGSCPRATTPVDESSRRPSR